MARNHAAKNAGLRPTRRNGIDTIQIATHARLKETKNHAGIGSRPSNAGNRAANPVAHSSAKCAPWIAVATPSIVDAAIRSCSAPTGDERRRASCTATAATSPRTTRLGTTLKLTATAVSPASPAPPAVRAMRRTPPRSAPSSCRSARASAGGSPRHREVRRSVRAPRGNAACRASG